MTNTARLLASRTGVLCAVGRSAAPCSPCPVQRHSVFPSCVFSRRAGPAVYTTQALRAPSREEVITQDPANNVSDNIFKKIGVGLHQQEGHPLCIIKGAIQDFFDKKDPGLFETLDDLYPIVSAKANFDDILIPKDHVSRSPNDTYYVSSENVLRCHTSAHQAELLRAGKKAFLCTGDVYRRDSIDSTHYPVFHQTEGVKIFEEKDWKDSGMEATEFVTKELKSELEGLAKHLFGDVQCRWVDAYFPFTEPSYELEIYFKDEWLEVLGCGMMEQEILDKNYGPGHKAWAFGLGLERLAMVLFNIPDIRLFWTEDPRFKDQFKSADLTTRFKTYSKYPPCFKDIAFWISPKFSENNLCELVRDVAGDLCEEVKLIDEFTHPKTERTSHCYRITFRSMERSLTDEEINELQFQIRDRVASEFQVELR
ncbi:hypothetical protein BSKO_01977 [Bryopsis sp. KO-2023]|nr:hypothetical protein BSKO_01977 [Bryopsis sp. KO-2023]